MKMLDIDVSELDELSKVAESEALEFLNDGVEVICRIHPREFIGLSKKSEFEQCKKLQEEKIYDSLQFFIN